MLLDAPPTIVESLHAPRRAAPKRTIWLYLALTAVIATLTTRSFYLQVLHGFSFLSAAEGNRVQIEVEPSPRGIIFDHFGKQLVENIASTDVVIDPTLLPNEEDEGTIIERLPTLIDIKPEKLRHIVATARTSQRTTVVIKALPHDAVLAIEEALPTLPGVRLASSLVRKYPLEQTTAHVTGYTSAITADELSARQSLFITDITGKAGLEKQYDELLHGQHGSIFLEVNAQGRTQKQLNHVSSIPGASLTTTLDSELQQRIFQLLSERDTKIRTERHQPTAGAVVALDPRSGAIRALVSYPSFNPNVFSQPALSRDSADLINAELTPLFNRVVDGNYAPGSTIKPFIAAAALEEGVITPQTTFLSTGGLSVGTWQFPDWKSGGHGITDLNKAIAESVNTFFYLITGGDDTRTGLGVKRTTQYLEQFNWGKPTGLDLPTESSGFLPSPQWKEKTKHERWYIGDTYHLGIGQGDVAVTPLQLATATATIATGGTWHKPHLIESYTPHEQKPITTKVQTRSVKISRSHIASVKQAMRHTVTSGSGIRLADLPIELAGKTGTAQVGESDTTHAWFTSFGPYDNSELVITVLLEKGGEGDKDAVPLAKEIWQWWIENGREDVRGLP